MHTDTRREQLAWAAGLFEGEGCFSTVNSRRGPLVSLGMTDLDVVKRFHEIVGVGRIYEQRQHSRQAHWKRYYMWQAGKAEDVEHVVNLLWAWLGPRRREAARKMLDASNARVRVALRRGERTECKRGHPWIESNLYLNVNGTPQCRTCRREAQKRWDAKNPDKRREYERRYRARREAG